MKKTEKTITGSVDPDVLEFTVGDDPILDRELVKWDAAGTAAHVTMLSRMKMPKGVPPVVTPAEAAKVRRELAKVVKEFAAGKFEIREADQDVGYQCCEACYGVEDNVDKEYDGCEKRIIEVWVVSNHRLRDILADEYDDDCRDYGLQQRILHPEEGLQQRGH